MPRCGCAPSWRKRSRRWTACPSDVVLSAGARSADAVVAVPILQYSPLLSDADLIEIIACGQVQEVLTAIASRKPVSEAGQRPAGAVAGRAGGGGAAGQSATRKSARKRWTASSNRPRRSAPGICRWRCAPICRRAPSAASARLVGAVHPGTAGGAQRSVGCHPHPSEPRTAGAAGGSRRPAGGPGIAGRAGRRGAEGRPAGRRCSWNRRPRPASARW